MQALVTNHLQNNFNTLKVHFSASFQQKTARTASRFQQVLHKMGRVSAGHHEALGGGASHGAYLQQVGAYRPS